MATLIPWWTPKGAGGLGFFDRVERVMLACVMRNGMGGKPVEALILGGDALILHKALLAWVEGSFKPIGLFGAERLQRPILPQFLSLPPLAMVSAMRHKTRLRMRV